MPISLQLATAAGSATHIPEIETVNPFTSVMI
jgi:hypothetical protein